MNDAWENTTAVRTVYGECKKKVTSLLSSLEDRERERGRIRKSRGTGKGSYVLL
jgi:hypothetical protein